MNKLIVVEYRISLILLSLNLEEISIYEIDYEISWISSLYIHVFSLVNTFEISIFVINNFEILFF
jgi:hypothetical protein